MTTLPDAEQLTLETGGQRYQGWLAVRVTRGVEMCPSNFECHVTERFPGQFTNAIIEPGNTCRVFLGNDLVMTGWINVYAPSIDAHTHTVIVAGRSLTQDIVDSSTNLTAVEFTNLQGSMKAAMEFVLKQFPMVKLNFIAKDVNIVNPLHLVPGMTAYEVIEILANYGQKMIWDDANGNLVVSDVGTEQAGSALVEGKNIEIAAARKDDSQRFHQILVIGQNVDGTDGYLNRLSHEPHGVDDAIRNERLKIIIWDLALLPGAPDARADWERNRRRARGDQIQITVTGWRDGNNKLWTPNTLCSIQCPTLRVNANWLISEVSWIRGDNGTQTIMTLMDKQGFGPAPFVPPTNPGGQTP